MNRNELFAVHRSSKRLNEGLERTFGKKINLENFSLEQLQDARNKLRTQISQVRSESNFNENLENDAYHQAKFMLDAINAEIEERDQHIVETDVEEGSMKDVDYDLRMIANDGDEEELISALQGEMGSGVADVLNDMMSELQDDLAAKGMDDVIDDNDKMIEMLWDKLVDEYGGDDEYNDDGGETDDNYALASAGFGSDEDYESVQNEKAPAAVRNIVGGAAAAIGGVGGALLGNMFAPIIGGVAGAVGGAAGGAKVGSETADAIWDQVSSMLGGEKKATEAGIAHAKAAKAGENSFEFDGKEYEVTLKPQEVGKAVADLKAVKEAYAMEVSSQGFKEDRKSDQNFTPDDIKNLEKIDDIETLKSQAFDLISKPSKRPMKPEKVDWFKRNLEMKKDKVSIIKLMWDLLLAGEGMRVVGGGRGSERYRQRFGDSIENQGEGMNKLQEGEIQQAQSIVTAKSMVDRVSRWIEELAGMENDQLLELGDVIRDEMGQEQARAFLSQVAPAIQTALDSLKQSRETLASGMRMLTGQEQSAEMLGSEPESEEAPPAGPDTMNAEPAMGGDEFAAAEPAVGGGEAVGREQRESIQFQNRLMKVLAG